MLIAWSMVTQAGNQMAVSSHFLAQHKLLHFAGAVPGRRFYIYYLLGPLKAR